MESVSPGASLSFSPGHSLQIILQPNLVPICLKTQNPRRKDPIDLARTKHPYHFLKYHSSLPEFWIKFNIRQRNKANRDQISSVVWRSLLCDENKCAPIYRTPEIETPSSTGPGIALAPAEQNMGFLMTAKRTWEKNRKYLTSIYFLVTILIPSSFAEAKKPGYHLSPCRRTHHAIPLRSQSEDRVLSSASSSVLLGQAGQVPKGWR